VEEILLFNKLFPIVDNVPSYEDIARQSCAAMVRRWRILAIFLRPGFSVSVSCISLPLLNPFLSFPLLPLPPGYDVCSWCMAVDRNY